MAFQKHIFFNVLDFDDPYGVTLTKPVKARYEKEFEEAHLEDFGSLKCERMIEISKESLFSSIKKLRKTVLVNSWQ